MSDEGSSHRREGISFLTISDLVMGALYIGIAIWVFFAKHLGNFAITGPFAYAFEGLLIVYGSFRLYRGMVALRARRNS